MVITTNIRTRNNKMQQKCMGTGIPIRMRAIAVVVLDVALLLLRIRIHLWLPRACWGHSATNKRGMPYSMLQLVLITIENVPSFRLVVVHPLVVAFVTMIAPHCKPSSRIRSEKFFLKKCNFYFAIGNVLFSKRELTDFFFFESTFIAAAFFF